MKRRWRPERAILLAALLFACLLALAPAAWASGASASPAAGLPTVTYTVPSTESAAQAVTAWSGNSVLVDYEAGTSPVVAAKCELYVNDSRVTLAQPPVDMSLGNGAAIQFPVPDSYSWPHGDLKFKVVLVTKAGQRAEYDWTYTYGGAPKPKLIDFGIMRQWWWYIAKGGLVVVELTVISIAFAMVFALFGALGRLSGGIGLKQAWEKSWPG